MSFPQISPPRAGLQLRSFTSFATAGPLVDGPEYHVVLLRRGTFAGQQITDGVAALTPYARLPTDLVVTGEGYVVSFHPDFYCIYETDHEARAESVLFLDVAPSVFSPLGDLAPRLYGLCALLEAELAAPGGGDWATLNALLHSLLVYAVRAKTQEDRPPLSDVVQRFVQDVERHFREDHRPAAYAERLHCTPQTLSRQCRRAFGLTSTGYLQRRIMRQAKRELYLTNRPVREVAFGLGFEDEFYFSRLFRKVVGVAPVVYRASVGVGKGADLV